MAYVKPLRINLDDFAHELLLQAKRNIVERNKECSVAGRFKEMQGATFKDIVQRGIMLVAAEVRSENII